MQENYFKFIHSCVWVHARFACLSSDWATTTGRLLGLTTCLLHEDGGILLCALPLSDVVVRASAFQSVNLGFILLIESYQKTLKMVFTTFLLGAQHIGICKQALS